MRTRPGRSKIEIRETDERDAGAIARLYPEAFPNEDLLPVVQDLHRDPAAVATSLVGLVGSRIAGHVLFTRCGMAGSEASAALLAPLAVAPAWQRQGVGTALVRAGLRQLQDLGVGLVFVLGDPAYYRRFGFLHESIVEPPFRVPPDQEGAWQSLQRIGETTVRRLPGKLSVPPQWLQPALWAP